MPVLGFKKQFAKLVEDGSKLHTIRAKRKRPIKEGDVLYLAEGVRTKQYRCIKKVKCTKVQNIVINWAPPSVLLESTGFYSNIQMDGEGIRNLAHDDGFSSVADFYTFFVSEKNPRFEGQLIWWTA